MPKPTKPVAIERRYVKRIKDIIDLIHEVIIAAIVPLGEIWPDMRHDADDNIMTLRSELVSYFEANIPRPVDLTIGSIRHQLEWARRRIANAFGEIDLADLISSHTIDVDNFAIAQLKSALGVSVKRDLPEIAALMTEWVEENVNLIDMLSITSDPDGKKCIIDRLIDTIIESHNNGLSLRSLQADIRSQLGISERRAEFIARDQILKLNGRIMQERQTTAGIAGYTWDTSRDERVRPSHRDLHNTHQLWATPPSVGGGRREHPGGDFRCRCVAIPDKPAWMEG